jgi:uncharacterized protein (TIGR02231 family)
VKLTNQEEAPLMPGQVAIFAGSDFLGNSHLPNFVVPGEEFELPFGRHNNVDVERKISVEKRTQTSDKVKIDRTITIKLTNRGKIKRSVRLEEPLPVSRDSRIQVSFRDITPRPAASRVDGKAEWSIDLEPGQSAEVNVPYRIEYPDGVMVVGL